MVGSQNRRVRLTPRYRVLAWTILAALSAALPAPLTAQTMNDRFAQRQQGGQKSRMLVDAREVIYDRDKDRVSAAGDVQVYYQGKVLEADRVIYDRKTKRVFAEGNAKLTETDGTKTYGDRFDLTDDFKDGFIDSLRVETPKKTRLSAPRAERTSGEQTILERGTFTACEPCKDDPSKPPLWQVRGARIIHNNAERRIYYENATLEFWGYPVGWLPFFSAPDPSVNNASGILAPRIFNKTSLGKGIGVPLFWSIAPNYDVTFTPTYLSRQGFFADLLWRHRLENGSYNLRVNGINQMDRKAFSQLPYLGAGDKTFRGSIESRGKFYLNEKWTFGWDGAWATDKHYFTDYKTKPVSMSTLFYTEIINQVYLRGQGERSWFDLTAYQFTGLNAVDWQRQIEKVGPSFDFDRRFTPGLLGGELRVTANGAAIQRDAAVFQPITTSAANRFYAPGMVQYSTGAGGLYMPCRYNYVNAANVVTQQGSYTPGNCLLRGFAGEYTRASIDVGWRRKFIDPIGQEWTPFVGLRADAAWLNLNLSRFNAPDPTLGPAGYGNANQAAFLGGNSDNFLFRAMPMVGLEYRYPFFAMTNWGIHHFEPIGQLVVRPNETRIGKLPNEDAQSLIFDENSIFSLNKFSGFDRIEGGSRLNYGARYSFRSNNDIFVGLLFGQSIQLSGRNSFAAYDLANTGRNSGLESRRSDYVAAATIQPFTSTSFTVRARFDEKNFSLQRLDAQATTTIGKLSLHALYSRVAPQPELGYPLRREGVFVNSVVQLPRNFYVSAGALYDLDRYLTDRATTNNGAITPYKNTPWRLATTVLSLGYRDECTDLSFSYSRSVNDLVYVNNNTPISVLNRKTSTYMMRLVLKDLGEVQYSQRSTRD